MEMTAITRQEVGADDLLNRLADGGLEIPGSGLSPVEGIRPSGRDTQRADLMSYPVIPTEGLNFS
jgi:hypothetical protein